MLRSAKGVISINAFKGSWMSTTVVVNKIALGNQWFCFLDFIFCTKRNLATFLSKTNKVILCFKV